MSSETSAPPGPLPAVHDEAADTPPWIPVVGLAGLLLMLLWMLYRASVPAEVVVPEVDAAAEAPSGAEGAEAE